MLKARTTDSVQNISFLFTEKNFSTEKKKFFF